MHKSFRSRALVTSSGWVLALACGSRTGLPPGRVLAEAGAANVAGAPAEPMCMTAAECPQPPPGQCGSAACISGSCSLDMGQLCDDGDP